MPVPIDEPRYSLLTEPWIKVVMNDNTIQQFGLLDFFENINGISSLIVDADMEDPALFRLFLAIVYRALDPVLEDDWFDWWESNELPVDRIIRYLNDHEDEFWLYHPSKPFLQTMIEPKDDATGAIKDLGCLIAEPTGNDFGSNRSSSKVHTLGDDETARRLIASLQYDRSAAHASYKGCVDEKQNKVYATRAYLGGMSTIRLKTGNMFKDILLSLIPLDSGLFDDSVVNGANGLTAGTPLWEIGSISFDGNGTGKEPLHAKTVEEALVWPSRRIRLFTMSNGTTGTLISSGRHVSMEDSDGIEPMAAFYNFQEKKNAPIHKLPVQARPDKSFWRSLTSLTIADGNTPPMTLKWASELRQDGYLETSSVGNVTVITTRYDATNASKVTSVLSDSVSLPIELIENMRYANEIAFAIRYAEAIVRYYRDLLIGIGMAKGDRNALTNKGKPNFSYRESQISLVYDAIGEEFYKWVLELPNEEDDSTMMESWADSVEGIVKKSIASDVSESPLSALLGRRVMQDKNETIYSIAGALNDFERKVRFHRKKELNNEQ